MDSPIAESVLVQQHEEVHRFVNDLERPIGTHLYGRRLYEVMRYWETAPTGDGELSAEQDYAQIWQAAAITTVLPMSNILLERSLSGQSSSPMPTGDPKIMRCETP